MRRLDLPFPTRPFTLANGLGTRLLDTGGAGVPVVLLHGMSLSIEIWAKVIEGLARERRVIAFDFPGYGEAEIPDAAYDGAFFAAQIMALLDALSLPRAHLLGSSMGASAIVRLAPQAGDRIARAVLMAPGGFGRACNLVMRLPALPLIGETFGRPGRFNNAFTLRLGCADPSLATDSMVALMTRFSARPGQARAFLRTVRAGVGPFGVRGCESFAAAAARLGSPTLVLWGEKDRVFPPYQAGIAARILPDAQSKLIADCGHYPQWEAPARVIDEVNAHLASD